MSLSKCNRKLFFVSQSIQGSILSRCAGYWLVYHIFLWHVMFVYSYIRYWGELAMGGTPMSFAQLYMNFSEQHFSILVCSIAILPLLAWDMTHFTHRIAGPLVRLRNELRRLGRDETVSPVKLRKGDLMHEIIDAFNEFLSHQNSRTQAQSTSRNPLDSQESDTLAEVQAIQQEVALQMAPASTSTTGQTARILLQTEAKWG